MRTASTLALLLLASNSLHAELPFVVSEIAVRGSVVANSTSQGAFTASPELFQFQNLTYTGDASFQWILPDSFFPGNISEATTFSSDNGDTADFTFIFTVPGAGYYQGGSGDTLVPPIAFTAPTDTFSYTLTPVDATATRFTLTCSGAAFGTGTAQITVAGSVALDDTSTYRGSVSTSHVLRVTGGDPSVLNYPDLLITARSTGHFDVTPVPEPATWASALGIASLLASLRMRRRGLGRDQECGASLLH